MIRTAPVAPKARPADRPHPAQEKMTEAQQALVVENIGLAYAFAIETRRKYPRLGEDIESLAFLALCNAAIAYDPGRGTTFATLAYTCMRNQIHQELATRRESQAAVTLPFSAIASSDGWIPEPADYRTDAADVAVDRAEDVAAIRRCLAELPERERFVLECWAMEGDTLTNVALNLADHEKQDRPMCKERVRQLANQGARRIARMLRAPIDESPMRLRMRLEDTSQSAPIERRELPRLMAASC